MLSMNFLRFLSLNIAQIYLEFSSKYEIGGYLMGKTNRFFSYCSDFNEYGKDFFWSKKDDTGKSRYYFKIDDTLIEVSYEVYMVCMKSEKKLEYAEKVQIKRNYRSLDNKNDYVESELHKSNENRIVDFINKNELYEMLFNAIKTLNDLERKILFGIYFEDMSERQLAKKLKIPQRTINYKKHKILLKLKNQLFEK